MAHTPVKTKPVGHVALPALDPALKAERIAHTKAITEALVTRVQACQNEDELETVKLEMEALPLNSFHWLARLTVRDAIVKKIEELYK